VPTPLVPTPTVPTPPARTTPARTTLLVIDVQEAALVGCFDVPGVMGRINDLLQRAREAGAAIVFIQHEDADDPEMTAGSMGWQLAEALDRRDGDTVVAKTYRDSFAATELGATLERSGTQRLVVTGAHSDFCVQTTALSALPRGYDVTLVGDAHTTRPVVLPAGELGAEAVVAFVNSRVATMRHPGRTVEVRSAADVWL
jgi:nicotinamidase-related amidase